MIKIDKVIESISSFLKDRFEHMKGDIIEKISSIISKLISFFILFLIFLFTIGFASLTLAKYINSMVDSDFSGYGIISAFYLIVFIVLYKLFKTGKLKKAIESEMRRGLKG